MKRKIGKAVAAGGLSLMLAAGGVSASAMNVPRALELGGGSTRPAQGQMVLRQPGEYTLRGDLTGGIRVDPGQGEVKLILDGARLGGGSGPAIEAVSGDRLSIELAPGSQNQLDAGAQRGAVYSSVPLEVNGSGRLDLWSQGAFFTGPGGQSFQSGGNVQMNPGQAPQGATPGGQQNGQQGGQQGGQQQNGQQPEMPGSQQQSGQQPGMPGGMGEQNTQPSTDAAGEIVEGTTENSAMDLAADLENAVTYTLTQENGTVKISEAGTYVVTGTVDEGSITVKKGTTGVVLILENVDLTSTSGAALSINKNAEVQVVISGNVILTDNENPEDENSTDEAVADAYDGAALKIKAESVVFLTGDGTLTVNGNAKNGVKAGDDTSLIIGGDVTVNINAVNDGINGNYDVTILSGEVTVAAGDDGIHADHILTVGQDGQGPDLTVTRSTEGLEGTVVNIAGGTVNVTASDDAINAANADGAYEGELDYSVNITGGDVTLRAGTDGIDSNGNVNLVDGSATIRSANNGGDAGVDYDGDYYVSPVFQLNNQSGVAGPDGMPGGMGGQQPGAMGGQQMNGPQSGQQMPSQQGQNGAPGPQNGGAPGGFGPGR